VTKYFGLLASVLLLALVFSSPASAALSCAGGTYFMETGVSPSDSSQQQNAEACVTIGSGTITVVIQNDDSSVTNVPSVLDGFSIMLSGAATGVAFATSSAVVPTGFIDCTSGSCTTVGTFNDYSGTQPNPQTSPFEWGVVTGASGAPINQTFSTTDPAVLAGGGSLRPAGIIGTLASTSGETGLNGNGHNDYLLGPATFNLTYTGSGLTANSFTFYWGTTGDAHTSGPVPEPTSILLLGTVLAFVGKFLKTRLAV
jgi:hypothetical protein